MGIASILRRAGRMYADFTLGTGNEAFTKAMRNTIKNRGSQSYFSSVWDGMKNGARAAEAHNLQIQQKGGFWRNTWESLKSTPKVVSEGWAKGGAGKTGWAKGCGQFKGALKGLGKRMPLIGTLMIAATELPNIFTAFKEGGLVTGVTEIGKAGLRLGAGMAGAAIGQALIPIPILGGIVGYMAGDWLMSKVTGKSYSEKKEEANNAIAQSDQQAQQAQQVLAQTQMQPGYSTPTGMLTNPSSQMLNGGFAQPTVTPQQLMAMQQQLYGGAMNSPMDQDFMAMTSGLNKLNFQC